MARAAIFRVANNQHDSVFRPVLGICCEYWRGSKKDHHEKASVHKRDDYVRGRNVNVSAVAIIVFPPGRGCASSQSGTAITSTAHSIRRSWQWSNGAMKWRRRDKSFCLITPTL